MNIDNKPEYAWAIVPSEATEAMCDAGNDGAAPYMVDAKLLWRQMLAAAPRPAIDRYEYSDMTDRMELDINGEWVKYEEIIADCKTLIAHLDDVLARDAKS